jgi:hypothetical protein
VPLWTSPNLEEMLYNVIECNAKPDVSTCKAVTSGAMRSKDHGIRAPTTVLQPTHVFPLRRTGWNESRPKRSLAPCKCKLGITTSVFLGCRFRTLNSHVPSTVALSR